MPEQTSRASVYGGGLSREAATSWTCRTAEPTHGSQKRLPSIAMVSHSRESTQNQHHPSYVPILEGIRARKSSSVTPGPEVGGYV